MADIQEAIFVKTSEIFHGYNASISFSRPKGAVKTMTKQLCWKIQRKLLNNLFRTSALTSSFLSLLILIVSNFVPNYTIVHRHSNLPYRFVYSPHIHCLLLHWLTYTNTSMLTSITFINYVVYVTVLFIIICARHQHSPFTFALPAISSHPRYDPLTLFSYFVLITLLTLQLTIPLCLLL